jgi:PAS domain-containing protein
VDNESVPSRADVWDAVTQVVERVEAELDVFAADVAERVLDRIETPATVEQPVRRCVRAAVSDTLARLRSRAALPQELPPGLVELARLRAGSQCDPTELADAWLVGQEAFWTRFALTAEQAVTDAAIRWEAVKTARLHLSGHAASLSTLFRSAWEAELDTDPHVEAVSRALEGHWVDTTELGYDLAYHHVAVVADSPSTVDVLAGHTARQRVVVAGPGGETWGWLGGRSPMSDGELDAVAAWLRARDDGTVAFGEPGAGIAGFATSHRQALEARTIAAATSRHVVRFADLRLLAAVLRDEELAKGFVERELGELDDAGERTHELTATLRAYLEHGQSISATAALRRRDRKTIARQLRDAERLIHHRVSERSEELLIALQVAEILRGRVANWGGRAG